MPSLDLAYVRGLQDECRRLRLRVEELEHDVKMLKALKADMLADNLPGLEHVPMTNIEKQILARLDRGRPHAVSRDAIFSWLYSARAGKREPTLRIVDVYVTKIRKKIDGTTWRVQTVLGFGYLLERVGDV